jgi:prevent-host-death family protein
MKGPSTYSTYEAKARFSELLRKVRAGESVFITYRGEEVAEIRPVERDESIEALLERLEENRVVSGAPARQGELVPLARRPGALSRFLASRLEANEDGT